MKLLAFIGMILYYSFVLVLTAYMFSVTGSPWSLLFLVGMFINLRYRD